jgi:glycosyltransferase involved in cell wall biosynthesis
MPGTGNGVKLAIVNFVIDPRLGGGTAAKSVALARALVSAGHDAHLVTTDIGLDDGRRPLLPGVQLTVFEAALDRFPVPLTTPAALVRLLDGCDAVIVLNHWNVLNAMTYVSAKRLRIPLLFCPAGALSIQGRSRWLKWLYDLAIGRRLVADAAALIATTEVEAQQFRVAGIEPDRIRIIPNGIEPHPSGLTAEEFRARLRLPAGPILLFMGRLNAIKGPDLLLDAFVQVASRHGEWQLVMAGRDEGLGPALRSQAANAGLEQRVHIVGHLLSDLSIGAYLAASLLAVPSRHEAMSLVALEAGVVGTPVLLTDVCGFDEVESVGGGRVVSATAADLAAGLHALLAASDRLPAMGQRLQELVLARFGWPTIVQKYLALAADARRRYRL